MERQVRLLTDQQVQQFIEQGYLLVQADGAEELHRSIREELDTVYEREGNPGNNLLPRIPAISQVFDHPAVRGALTSLLGADHVLNPHRYGHLNPPGSKGQAWHKDCYVFDHNIRHPRFRWLLALYYPQDVTEDMGPTGLIPRFHAYARISSPDPGLCQEPATGLVGPAGTVALVHMDAWHRATANTSTRNRYMLKFQFARMEEPSTPTWDHQEAAWEPATDAPRKPLCRDVWNWLRGRQGETDSGPERLETAWRSLRAGTEPARRRAAFELGLGGEENSSGLLDTLREEAREGEAEIEARTPDNAHGTNPTALPSAQGLTAGGTAGVEPLLHGLADAHWLVRASAADALGWIGPSAGAADALAPLMDDPHWWVRRNAIEALGRMGSAAGVHAGRLVPCLSDEDRRVRRVSALALAQLGTPAEGAAAPLLQMLDEDPDRYNRYYAALALRRLPSPEGREALLDLLCLRRWCPISHPKSPY